MGLEGGRETGEIQERVENLWSWWLGDKGREKLKKLINKSHWRPGKNLRKERYVRVELKLEGIRDNEGQTLHLQDVGEVFREDCGGSEEVLKLTDEVLNHVIDKAGTVVCVHVCVCVRVLATG